jgi:hypothetical protein
VLAVVEAAQVDTTVAMLVVHQVVQAAVVTVLVMDLLVEMEQ